MGKEYQCIKEFVLNRYKDNEPLETEQFVVPLESTWHLREHSYMSDVRLESDLGWLEIDIESFKSLFVEV